MTTNNCRRAIDRFDRANNHQLSSILRQPAITYVGATTLPLDHPDRVYNLGLHLSLSFLNLALGFVELTVLGQVLIRATPYRNLPDDFAPFMLRPFLDADVIRIGNNHVSLTMQQFVDLGHPTPGSR